MEGTKQAAHQLNIPHQPPAQNHLFNSKAVRYGNSNNIHSYYHIGER